MGMRRALHSVRCVNPERMVCRRQQLRVCCVRMEHSATNQAQVTHQYAPCVFQEQRILFWALQNAKNARMELTPSRQGFKHALNAELGRI